MSSACFYDYAANNASNSGFSLMKSPAALAPAFTVCAIQCVETTMIVISITPEPMAVKAPAARRVFLSPLSFCFPAMMKSIIMATANSKAQNTADKN